MSDENYILLESFQIDDDVKIALIIVGGIVSAIMAIAFSVSWYYTVTTKAAIKAGYEQATLPGEIGVHWVKPKAKEGGE